MLAVRAHKLCKVLDLEFEFNPGAPPEGCDAKNRLCCPLHFRIPGKGPLPVCPGRPSVDRHTLLQVLLAGQQFLLLDQQALNVGLDLHMQRQTLPLMSLNVQVGRGVDAQEVNAAMVRIHRCRREKMHVTGMASGRQQTLPRA